MDERNQRQVGFEFRRGKTARGKDQMGVGGYNYCNPVTNSYISINYILLTLIYYNASVTSQNHSITKQGRILNSNACLQRLKYVTQIEKRNLHQKSSVIITTMAGREEASTKVPSTTKSAKK